MKKNVLRTCPVCGQELIISKLKCVECDMEISGGFQISLFSKLEDSEIEFIKAFLKNEGNISKLQNETGKTYAGIKNLLNVINIKLGTIKEEKNNIDMRIFDQKEQTGVVKIIQEKLLECGGKSKMPMLKGDPLDIWVTSSGKGIANSGFVDFICEWHILEAIVRKANELGGIMYRGDAAAQNGAKIGSDELLGGSRNYVELYCNDAVVKCTLTMSDLMSTYFLDEDRLDDVYISEMLPSKMGWNNPFLEDEIIRGYTDEMRDFMDAIYYDREPKSGFDIAYDTTRITYAAYKSSELGVAVRP